MKQLSLLAALLLPLSAAFAGSGQNEVSLPRYYGGYGGGSEDIEGVRIFSNIVPLYNVMPQKAGNITATGGGLGVQLELGVKVPFTISRGYGGGGVNTFLSFSLGYQVANIKTKYTDAQGNSHEENSSFDKVVLPIAIGGLHGNGRARFFWQGGLAIGYMGGSSHTGLVKSYDPLSIAPFISLGVSGDGEIKRGPLAGRNAKSMFGPFFSYTVNNMTSVSNATAHNYTIGLQLTSVFL